MESANVALPFPSFEAVSTGLKRNPESLTISTLPTARFSFLDLQVLENPYKKHSNCPL